MTKKQKRLTVEGMTCGHCKKSVGEALTRLGGVSSVSIDLETKQVDIDYDESLLDETRIRSAIEAIGFDVA